MCKQLELTLDCIHWGNLLLKFSISYLTFLLTLNYVVEENAPFCFPEANAAVLI